MTQEQKRIDRMNTIKNTFEKAKLEEKTLDKEKLIAQGCFNWGASRRTVMEYIRIVEIAGDYTPW